MFPVQVQSHKDKNNNKKGEKNWRNFWKWQKVHISIYIYIYNIVLFQHLLGCPMWSPIPAFCCLSFWVNRFNGWAAFVWFAGRCCWGFHYNGATTQIQSKQKPKNLHENNCRFQSTSQRGTCAGVPECRSESSLIGALTCLRSWSWAWAWAWAWVGPQAMVLAKMPPPREREEMA